MSRLLSHVVALLLTAPACGAPSWAGKIAPLVPGTFPPLAPCRLEYTLGWNGMPESGRITLEFSDPGETKRGVIVARASAASKGPAARLFPYQSDFWSEITPATLRPRYFQSTEATKGETEVITNRFSPAAVRSVRSTTPQGATAKTTTTTFPRKAFDIPSALLFVRSQPLADGDTLSLPVHPFHSPYLLDLTVAGRETRKGLKLIRLQATLRKLDRRTLEPVSYKKLKGAVTLWISDDARRVPVELRAPVFIGEVRATLAAHHPRR